MKLTLNIYIALMATGLFFSCKKDKADNINKSSLDVLKTSPSNIRLFNFTDFDADMTINNIPLTAYGIKDGTGAAVIGTGNATQLGLQFFPKEAWKAGAGGSPFILPTSLLDKNGRAEIRLLINTKTIDTIIQNNTLQPKDYYLFRKTAQGKDILSYVVLNREANPPAAAENFKVRILNYQQTQDPLGLTGPVTLTYADGTPVHAKLSNIAPNTASEYVELPYGAYQFKLFLSNGSSIDVEKQMTELPVQPDFHSAKPLPQPQQGVIIPVRTYKPGGAYTMLVSAAAMSYQDKYPDGTGDPVRVDFNMNIYRVVADIEPAVNFSFARVQAANAYPGPGLNFMIDGQRIANGLDFGKNSEYYISTRGAHTVSITDASGKKLAEKSLTLYPYDNYTIWATQKKDGSADIVFAAVSMTSAYYETGYGTPSGVSGTDALRKKPYAWSTRFLNLSPDVPLATFTNDHSLFIHYDFYQNLPFSGACNIKSNSIPDEEPFLSYAMGKRTLGISNPAAVGDGSAEKIRVYESTEGRYPELPGKLLASISPLNVKEKFIANRELYTSASLEPWAEPGIYTVALIGKTVPGAPEGEKARLMVIKHNK